MLFGWSEDEFLRLTEGSPIRRIGHERWLRNIAVAMGNALRGAVAGAAAMGGAGDAIREACVLIWSTLVSWSRST
jgi:epoxyqueuosine reductase QueG